MSEEPDTTSAADAIAAKAAPQPAAPEPEPEPDLKPTPWSVEPWRNRFLLVRHHPLPGTPMVKREIYGGGQFGSSATPFETEKSAQAFADKLNKEGGEGDE